MKQKTADVVPIRSWRREQAHRRRVVETALRDAAAWITAGIRGEIPLSDAVFGADRALIPAVREACKADIA